MDALAVQFFFTMLDGRKSPVAQMCTPYRAEPGQLEMTEVGRSPYRDQCQWGQHMGCDDE